MLTKISVPALLMILLTVFIIPSGEGKGPEIREEPGSIEFTLYKGEEHEDLVNYVNCRNTSMVGTLEAVNVECGLQCPSIQITSEKDVDLEPEGSMVIRFKIFSDWINEVGETGLSIDIIEDNGNLTTILEIIINIEHNIKLYSVCGGAGIISLFLIAIIVYRVRSKSKDGDNDPPSS